MSKHMHRTPFVMRGNFSKEWMEQFAKDMGFEWTYVAAQTIPKEKIEVRPLPPPTGRLNYIEAKYKDDAKI